MKPRFYLISSYLDNCEVEIQKSAYCLPGAVYLMTDNSRPILEHLKMLYAAEKEMNEWIRKYDNLLKGLTYWKDRALSK